jgi:plasmid maintenance system antidote protein VapI
MNINLLKAQILLNGRKIKDIANVLNISKSSIYRKINGKSDFTRREICKLISYLEIESKRAMMIFFDEIVS